MIAPIEDYWQQQQSDILAKTSGRSLLLAGDGRCDSPGFSAKYCTYSLMDTGTNLIVHTETLKRSQVLHLHVLSVVIMLWLNIGSLQITEYGDGRNAKSLAVSGG